METYANQIEKRSWIEVDLSQIRSNYLHYKYSLKRNACIMAVIKADAYGHGDVRVAKELADIGVGLFAVSNIDEAVGLRKAGIKGEILILGYSSPFFAKTLFDLDLTQTLVSVEYAEQLSKTGFRIKCQFAVDTGMNRIGIDADDAENCEMAIRHFYRMLDLNGLYTHLCVADSREGSDVAFTVGQLDKFRKIVNRVSDLRLPYIHCCNSAAGINYLDDTAFYNEIGSIVRLGILLYGIKPCNSSTIPDGINPALQWKSVVSMVKTVYPGETIGYGRSYFVEEESVIATVATGYADGLSRHLSNRGYVIINGKKAPIVGMICMDQIMVDVTNIPNVSIGSQVIILGRSGNTSCMIDDMAELLDTNNYEVVCNISKRVQRFYYKNNHSL